MSGESRRFSQAIITYTYVTPDAFEVASFQNHLQPGIEAVAANLDFYRGLCIDLAGPWVAMHA